MRIALLLPFALSLLTPACAPADEEDDSASSGEAVTLSSESCQTPEVKTAPQATQAGAPIAGTAHTTMSGCIVGAQNETGTALVSRITQLLGDTKRFSELKDPQRKALFSRFAAQPATGSLDTGLAQEIDIQLDVAYSPATRLRVVRRTLANGTYELRVSNVTPMRASFGLIPITVIDPGNLSVEVSIRPEANGVAVKASLDVKLEASKEKASATSQSMRDVFDWLQTELRSPP